MDWLQDPWIAKSVDVQVLLIYKMVMCLYSLRKSSCRL